MPSRAPQELAGCQFIRESGFQASFKDPGLSDLLNRSCAPKERRCPRRRSVSCLGPPCSSARRYGSGSHRSRLVQFTRTPTAPSLLRPALRIHMDDTRAPTYPDGGDLTSCMETPPPYTGRHSSDSTLMQAEIDGIAQKKRPPKANRATSPRTDPHIVPPNRGCRARSSSFKPSQSFTSVSIQPSSAGPCKRQTTHQDKPQKSTKNNQRIGAASADYAPRRKHRPSLRDLRKHLFEVQQGFPCIHSRTIDWKQTWN